MKKIKRLLLPLACNILLTPKSFTEPLPSMRRINCTKHDITLLANTSNNVMRIKTNSGHLYFRECKRHLEIHQYVAKEINFYYTQIHPELSRDRLFIETALSNECNFKKFVNMGITNDLSSGAYNFCVGNGGAYIGLSGITPDMEERVKDFVQYIWGDLFTYKLNSGLKRGYYQTYNAVRGIAAYRLADLLGIQNLIPKTEYALLSIDNEITMFGTVMNEAAGISVENMDVELRKNICSPALQRALNNLNVLDVICLEKDHRPGNYNVTIDEGKASGIVAFDNDSPNSFGIGGISFKTYVGCSPWIVNEGVNRPYIDNEVATSIFNVSDKELDDALDDILNTYQLVTLKRRIKKIKKILATIPVERYINKDEWTKETVKEELSGDYGNTYLAKFLEKQEIVYQPWIKNR